jgi:hypothetical protein
VFCAARLGTQARSARVGLEERCDRECQVACQSVAVAVGCWIGGAGAGTTTGNRFCGFDDEPFCLRRTRS